MFDAKSLYPPRTKMKTPFYAPFSPFRSKLAPIVEVWQKYPDVIAQYKLDGNRNVIHVTPDRKITMWNRGDGQHTPEIQKYAVPDTMREEILAISPEGHYTVWDTELMHFKTTGIKNTLYFYDVLVWHSEQLLGKTYAERYKILQQEVACFKGCGDEGRYLVPDADYLNKSASEGKHIWLAMSEKSDRWEDAWNFAKGKPWIEGLVLKQTGYLSKLQPGTQEINNNGFMCRVRKPKKNYLS